MYNVYILPTPSLYQYIITTWSTASWSNSSNNTSNIWELGLGAGIRVRIILGSIISSGYTLQLCLRVDSSFWLRALTSYCMLYILQA